MARTTGVSLAARILAVAASVGPTAAQAPAPAPCLESIGR
jgi:hypothetical protein